MGTKESAPESPGAGKRLPGKDRDRSDGEAGRTRDQDARRPAALRNLTRQTIEHPRFSRDA
jgi:hypothetical protein